MIKDSLGQPIERGDQIAYAVRSGNAGALRHYIVDSVLPNGRVKAFGFAPCASPDPSSRLSTLQQPQTHAVIVKKGAK